MGLIPDLFTYLGDGFWAISDCSGVAPEPVLRGCAWGLTCGSGDGLRILMGLFVSLLGCHNSNAQELLLALLSRINGGALRTIWSNRD